MILVALASALAAVLAMTLAWAVVKKAGDGGWTDVVWTFAVGAIAAGAALYPAEGAVRERQLLAAALIGLWSLRLGLYLAGRTWKAAHPDPRYEKFKAQWKGWGFKAWAFLQIQAATILILVISVRAAAIRPDAPIGWREALAAAILLIAVLGEGVADRQMAAFRRDPANKGRVADTGLWAWSRHPNYFFDWVAWLAWPVIALDGSPTGWLSLLAPALMWWLLNHVSGVPMLERQMVRSRGDAYRDYQARVSRFVPLPPRKAPH